MQSSFHNQSIYYEGQRYSNYSTIIFTLHLRYGFTFSTFNRGRVNFNKILQIHVRMQNHADIMQMRLLVMDFEDRQKLPSCFSVRKTVCEIVWCVLEICCAEPDTSWKPWKVSKIPDSLSIISCMSCGVFFSLLFYPIFAIYIYFTIRISFDIVFAHCNATINHLSVFELPVIWFYQFEFIISPFAWDQHQYKPLSCVSTTFPRSPDFQPPFLNTNLYQLQPCCSTVTVLQSRPLSGPLSSSASILRVGKNHQNLQNFIFWLQNCIFSSKIID